MTDPILRALGALGLMLLAAQVHSEDIQFRIAPGDRFVITDHNGETVHLEVLDSGAILMPGLGEADLQDQSPICQDLVTGRLGNCPPEVLEGQAGPVGPSGPPGPTGNSGPIGQSGLAGPRGSSVLNGFQWVREFSPDSMRTNRCSLHASACPQGKRVLSMWTHADNPLFRAVSQFPLTDTENPPNPIGMWVNFCNWCRVGVHLDCAPHISNPVTVEINLICVDIPG